MNLTLGLVGTFVGVIFALYVDRLEVDARERRDLLAVMEDAFAETMTHLREIDFDIAHIRHNSGERLLVDLYPESRRHLMGQVWQSDALVRHTEARVRQLLHKQESGIAAAGNTLANCPKVDVPVLQAYRFSVETLAYYLALAIGEVDDEAALNHGQISVCLEELRNAELASATFPPKWTCQSTLDTVRARTAP